VFTFAVDPQELFEERTRQMVGGWGIPEPVVAAVRAQVRDMWSESGSGWVPAWSEQAEQAEREGEWLLAALCWGGARFPCLATPSRQAAYERQLAAYERAVPEFSVRFERLVLEVPLDEGTTRVPVHVFRRRHASGRSLLVLCGGVDTWKVELHQMAVRVARATGLTVAAVDMPGTGETRLPLSPKADRVLGPVVEELAERYRAKKTSFFGISFGGHWAAKLALINQVDAAIDLGGPVGAGARRIDIAALPYGMPGILAHALGLEEVPAGQQADALLDAFSLERQGLLDGRRGAPLLAVNGEHDQFLPLADTTVFSSHPHATVWVIKDATHCAAEQLPRVIPAALGWLVTRLHDDAPAYRILEATLRLPLRPVLADHTAAAAPAPHAASLAPASRRATSSGPGATAR
jgi:esterase FrsA